ncbi:hypothetical protein SAPIO_CDS7909 [Scedosporium apiospermum]|uniref:Uncharacterized protein n=1 Tax=Pseudallescheria apiosperma TaxID=563466 RepID=A0A084G0P7_PSEDA|nr:uncharacterized protein SAPIO_CDS7909 [Scedosporium apiospermum]KEZ40909.1 hypothetical protein SAPIO_CDS7909 [Scedosporium apiospermum]
MRLLNAIVAISVMTGWAAAIPVDIAPSASGATSPNIPLVPLILSKRKAPHKRWWRIFDSGCTQIGGETKLGTAKFVPLTSKLPYTIELYITGSTNIPEGYF